MIAMKRLLIGLSFLLVASSVYAQPHTMATQVFPDRVIIGAEFTPLRLDLPNVLDIPIGTIFEPTADSTFDFIVVRGTLRVSRTHNTMLRATTIAILPMAKIDLGTKDDPIPANIHSEIIVRDVPIDLTRDPFQWGNGVINFGRADMAGAERTRFLPLTGSIARGSTFVTLSADVVGWQVGDEIEFPDTAQTVFPAVPRQEAKITIASIAGRTVGLSKPLDFDHLSILDPDGGVVLQPRISNLTSNVVIRSEHAAPDGTPGHTANIGGDATWDIRNVEFDDLGRTKNITLDVTTSCTPTLPDPQPPGRTWTCTHTGTNQIAKYMMHFHHAVGFGSSFIGNVLHGRGINGVSAKWCLSVHGTHDTLVQDNVCVGSPGSAYVTEDGYEVRNHFTHNFGVFSIGDAVEDRNSEVGDTEHNNPGATGQCFWLRGPKNYIDGNECWNSTRGINVFNQNMLPGSYPSVPGGLKDTPILTSRSDPAMVPLSFTNNIVAGNSMHGLEYWSVAKFPVVNLISANNGILQVFQSQSVLAEPYLVNPTLICTDPSAVAIAAGVPYVAALTIEGGNIAGCLSAVIGGGQVVTLKNVRLQNVLNLDWGNVPQQSSSQENVQHVSLPGRAPQYIRLGDDAAVWNGVLPLPAIGGNSLRDQLGSRHTIKNWQGTGQNFQLFAKVQLGSTPAWPSKDPWPYLFLCPDFPITTAQCYDRYGMAWFGEAVNDADTLPLTGLVSGYARPGLTPHFGPPRAVVTFPTMRAPAVTKLDPNNGNLPYIDYYGLITGDPNAATSTVLVSVDGRPTETARNTDGSTWHYWTYQTLPGTHEIRTWRTDGGGTPINPPMVFHYQIGAVTPPTCNAPNVIVNGKCVPPPPTCPTITLAPLTFSGQVGSPLALSQLSATGGTAPFTFTILSGALPVGTTLGLSGAFTGTPANAGSFTPTVRATDTASCTSAPTVVTLAIAAPPPVCKPPQVLQGNVCVTPPPIFTWKVLATYGVTTFEELFDQFNVSQNRYRYCDAGVCREPTTMAIPK